MLFWEQPQTALGWVLKKLFADKSVSPHDYKGREVVTWKFPNAGISLGKYVLVGSYATPITIAHEYGHCVQSQMLGPLYLLAVGVPSITQNILTRLGLLSADRYYCRFPERWADSLGGVKR